MEQNYQPGGFQSGPVTSQPGYGAPQPGYGAPPPMSPPEYSAGPPMAPPQAPPGCPPGLQYLTMVDQLVVKQKVELLEAFTGFETANKYKIFNSLGQEVYMAKEDTDC